MLVLHEPFPVWQIVSDMNIFPSIMSSTRILSLVMLAMSGLLGTSTGQNITDDAFFYGESPPVYPSRKFNSLFSKF